jgi:hypothetical protein
VFFDRVPDAWSRGVWAGEVQPLFNDPFSRAAHMERLHTALMYISPVALRARIAAWQEKTRRHELTPTINLFEPAIIPSPNGHALFYDTCAFLYHAVGADVFDAPENVFAHLHCGTWVKEADEVIPNLRAIHEAVYADRNKAQDLRRVQAEFYRQNALS